MKTIRKKPVRAKRGANPKPTRRDLPVSLLESASPFCGLAKAAEITFAGVGEGGKARTFIVLLHGAYNAMGLIGTECNGVAVLDKDRASVLADRLAPASSLGWYGGSGGAPTAAQLEVFEAICSEPWAAFRTRINHSKRNRYCI
jgi:hypothetical protein